MRWPTESIRLAARHDCDTSSSAPTYDPYNTRHAVIVSTSHEQEKGDVEAVSGRSCRHTRSTSKGRGRSKTHWYCRLSAYIYYARPRGPSSATTTLSPRFVLPEIFPPRDLLPPRHAAPLSQHRLLRAYQPVMPTYWSYTPEYAKDIGLPEWITRVVYATDHDPFNQPVRILRYLQPSTGRLRL